MSSREQDGLVTRIRQIRRLAARPNESGRSPAADPQQDSLRGLEARVAHLEQLLQGLQDSVHRESSRQSKRLGEIEARMEPAALSKALDQDARERGL